MTPSNVALIFAPTLLRPRALPSAHTKKKNSDYDDNVASAVMGLQDAPAANKLMEFFIVNHHSILYGLFDQKELVNDGSLKDMSTKGKIDLQDMYLKKSVSVPAIPRKQSTWVPRRERRSTLVTEDNSLTMFFLRRYPRVMLRCLEIGKYLCVEGDNVCITYQHSNPDECCNSKKEMFQPVWSGEYLSLKCINNNGFIRINDDLEFCTVSAGWGGSALKKYGDSVLFELQLLEDDGFFLKSVKYGKLVGNKGQGKLALVEFDTLAKTFKLNVKVGVRADNEFLSVDATSRAVIQTSKTKDLDTLIFIEVHDAGNVVSISNFSAVSRSGRSYWTAVNGAILSTSYVVDKPTTLFLLETDNAETSGRDALTCRVSSGGKNSTKWLAIKNRKLEVNRRPKSAAQLFTLTYY
eukprot:TRINITY_DN2604_c0_g1_i1.p1 TRINITY_DN2604_c0_g1~~TRINITY_DN2604_c0_g1_i1.p1  ORF type:complete len:408 (+),score=53.87 TRINITY_DN2604_c0_g1_i1:425-1648(+)